MPAPAKIANARSRQEWADIINADWRKSRESIIQTGRDLATAQNELSGDEFRAMVEADLSFSRTLAYQLIRIADHAVIGAVPNSEQLPSRLSVLVELADLDAEQFLDAQAKGLITPDLKVKAARAISGAYNKPPGEVIGGALHMRPSPSEARKIAQETNRIVAASDGNLYTGASNEEVGEYVTRRRAVFGIREAIERIADSRQSPGAWLADTESHWLLDFRLSAIDDAIAWLGGLKDAMEIVDA